MTMLKMVLFFGVISAGASSFGQRAPPPAKHDRAMAAIRKLGAKVTIDAERAGAPVAIVLTGSDSPTECLRYLSKVRNLQSCDL